MTDIMNNIGLLMNPRKGPPSSDAASSISSASRDSARMRDLGAGAPTLAHPQDATVRVEREPAPRMYTQASGANGDDEYDDNDGDVEEPLPPTRASPAAAGLPRTWSMGDAGGAGAYQGRPYRAGGGSYAQSSSGTSSGASSSSSGESTSVTSSDRTAQPMSTEQIMRLKRELLYQLERMEKKGMRLPRRFTMSDPLEDMRAEVERIKLDRSVDASVKFQRKMLMACVTGIEFLNTRYDPLDVKLDGWSDSMYESLDDYDDVFEELYLKYQSKAKMAPELKLLFMVGGSGMMFHLTRSMFRSASLPGLEQVMRQNPDLMRQFTQATLSTMQQQQAPPQVPAPQAPPPPPSQPSGGGLFGLLGNLLGGGGAAARGGSTGPKPAPPPPASYVVQPATAGPATPMINHLRGPVHVDEILRELHQQTFPNGTALHTNGGPPPLP